MSFKSYQRRAERVPDDNLSPKQMRRRKYDRHRTDSNRDFVRSEMQKRCSCEFCGLVDSLELYEWHHIDDTDANKVAISQMVTRDKQTRIEEEMNKCVMLCPNCHTKYHQDLLCMIDHKYRPDLIPFTHVYGRYYTELESPQTKKTLLNPLKLLFENAC
jgi:hypothetical protein